MHYPNKTNEELCELYQAGDINALEDILIKNHALIVAISKKFLYLGNNNMELDDLISIARIAAVESLQMYDCSQTTCKCSSYLSTKVRWALHKALEDTGFVCHIPNHMTQRAYKVIKLDSKLSHICKNEKIKNATIMKELNLTAKEFDEALRVCDYIMNACSLNKKSSDDGRAAEIGELVVEDTTLLEDVVIDATLTDEMNKIMEVLNAQEKKVIGLRFHNCLTLDKIGVLLGVSRARVGQIEKKALEKLKPLAIKNNLQAYLYA